MTAQAKAKWLRFLVLVLGGGTIYKLASLKDAFYIPMQEHMGLSHTQIGTLLSANAIVATALFVLGGFLADRFETRRLIPLGLIGAGGLGVYLASFPGFDQQLIVFSLLAVCADCLFWPSLLKAIRNLGNDNEQSRMFGFLEGGRGVVDTLVAFCALGVFVALGSGAAGLKAAILFYSAIDIGVGVLTLFLLKGDPQAAGGREPIGSKGLLEAVRSPGIWLVSLNVFMVYIVYCGLTYFIPYLKDMYHLPVALVGAYGIINQYFLKVLGGPAGGYIADKVLKSSSRYLKWAFLALLPLMLIILNIPRQESFIYAGMAATLTFALVVFTMRGVFWAPMSEVGIPSRITGSAFGIGCLIGYAPGMFAYVIYGSLLDRYPGELGYTYVFSLMCVLAVVGFGVSGLLQRMVKRRVNQQQAEALA
ncbi:MFS transporter [Pseudomonas plecoglossicida]|uniref:MFS transporter n=2 Tax=Pseudomonas plecoglossicida TaxID=70775 RepID=A0AAD0QV70_PSEDL|nr:MFS transporter [Pseudomonas plecoglossicida]AXM95335.1 MFS transporter [Pseudomonas plecoglossicida]EPB96470.1 major facilitator transporter [Pseudomonas plecoglossicida NB2011]QLB56084.1 MFS transporter [Pseudomonas plecoglossicida]GLR37527.1 MFS transporter [Pseudomonas plecoglossicida]